jgi:hypothetical protein
MHRKTILPDEVCALVTKDNRQDLELILPSGVTDNTVESTVAMYYLIVCYYRFLHDKEFVQEQMDWLETHCKEDLDLGEIGTARTTVTH